MQAPEFTETYEIEPDHWYDDVPELIQIVEVDKDKSTHCFELHDEDNRLISIQDKSFWSNRNDAYMVLMSKYNAHLINDVWSD